MRNNTAKGIPDEICNIYDFIVRNPLLEILAGRLGIYFTLRDQYIRVIARV